MNKEFKNVEAVESYTLINKKKIKYVKGTFVQMPQICV